VWVKVSVAGGVPAGTVPAAICVRPTTDDFERAAVAAEGYDSDDPAVAAAKCVASVAPVGDADDDGEHVGERPAVADDGDDDYEGPVAYQRRVHAEFLAEVGDAQTVTFSRPVLRYHGSAADDFDSKFALMQWEVSVLMSVAEIDDDDDDGRLQIGGLDLWTAPLDGALTYALDAVSQDSSAYLALFSDGDISDGVLQQLDIPFVGGLLIINRAYVHRALRGRDLGAWAVARAIRDLTLGSSEVLVVAYPNPTEERPGVSEAKGARMLARHWAKVGLAPIKRCPNLVGQSTAADALDVARADLDDVANLEITVTVSDLIAGWSR
jgi:hypothetical protein